MKRVVLEHLFPNVGQALQSLVQSGVQLCEVQTDDVVDTLLAEERGTGNCADTNLASQLFAEFHVGLTLLQVWRDVSQHEVSTLRIGVRNADAIQAFGEELLHVGIVSTEFLIVAVRHIQTNHSSFHQRRGTADGVDILLSL